METVPHRTPGPIPDVTEYTVPLPDGTPSDPAALLTAHARVLAALSGETEGAPGDELRVTVTDGTLRLSHRTGAFDTEAAARIAGYHLTALADPDRRSLLSEEELRFQLEELAGPVRELLDRRVHELFEERVGKHPDAVAAVQGERRWTYAELNSRANQIGRALLARGLKAEGVVAVVMERDLDWMAAVLGVFKAGGVYLPVEPHFPAERVSRTLSRAGCELVVTERGSTGSLSMTTATTLFVDAAYAESHADDDLGIPVAADQLAYIYFTSGSTGEPKGAMCEHAGFVNHVLAKVEDLGFGEDDVVAQTAPQCFDISLWQLLAGPVVGGRTLVIDQETVLDVPRFVDTVVRERVNVLQVVPSYLEAVLAELGQRPRELADLRCVSVTGEAVKRELVQRWFATAPGIRLANAYGLTETSDDTNHEVMDQVPDGDRVPLGGRCAMCACTSSTRTWCPCRWARRARSSSPGCAWGAGTSTTPSAPRPPSWRTRTGPASGSTAAVTWGAGGPTAGWSSSAAGTPRSRSAVSAWRSARSRTRCCGWPGCGTGPSWSYGGRSSPRSAPGPSRWARTRCGNGWPRRCRPTWCPPSCTGGSTCR